MRFAGEADPQLGVGSRATMGANARVMNQSCPVGDTSKQHADLELKICGILVKLPFTQMLAGEQLR